MTVKVGKGNQAAQDALIDSEENRRPAPYSPRHGQQDAYAPRVAAASALVQPEQMATAEELRLGRAPLAKACGIILLALPTWFSADAFQADIEAEYRLDPSQASLLTVAVNVGFVLGTTLSALLQLPDRVSGSSLVMVGSLVCGLLNGFMVTSVPFPALLMARLLSGSALCLVYPIVLRYISTWFRARRGLALGCALASFTIGVATPDLVRALLPGMPWRWGIAVPSVLALLASVLALCMREGPNAVKKSPVSVRQILRAVSNPRWTLATLAYMGHSFELFGGWAWMGAFLQSYNGTRGQPSWGAPLIAAATFWVIGMGSAGAVSAGLLADRCGRVPVVAAANLISGTCISLLPLVAEVGEFWQVLAVASLWGLSTVADSAQYSALVTEAVPDDVIGTSITLTVACGFLVTAVAVYSVPPLVRDHGWQGAFPVLGLGAALGLCAITCLGCMPRRSP